MYSLLFFLNIKQNSVKAAIRFLFTETECLVVSSDFKMPDENQILLKVPRHHNMYSFDMKTLHTAAKLWLRVLFGLWGGVWHACFIAKAPSEESKFMAQKLSHINFINLNKLVKGNLIRGFPASLGINDPGKLYTTSRQIKNQLSLRVKIIRSDNGTEFKNRDMLEFCGNKGIKQEYSNARTPQQNGVAKRMNRTLIEAARTMLADSLLPTTFWAEAVSTDCYIFNRLVTNLNASQAHPDVAPSQPSSSTIPVPSPSSLPVQSPPPIPTPIPIFIPIPIPETDPEPMEHTFEEPSPAYQHFSPSQEHAQEQNLCWMDLLSISPRKVKKLEGILKRKNVVFSDSEEEEPED
ncbi:ribonuclease H-like domain-containing protein [Tanacetum coccineum]